VITQFSQTETPSPESSGKGHRVQEESQTDDGTDGTFLEEELDLTIPKHSEHTKATMYCSQVVMALCSSG
jgi:hypothetical protein